MLLAGDIGGTKAMLALFTERSARFERRYVSRDFADFESMLARFLGEAAGAMRAAPGVEAACFGFAGPVEGERVRVTNLPWIVDAPGLCSRFGFDRARLLNDFAAAA